MVNKSGFIKDEVISMSITRFLYGVIVLILRPIPNSINNKMPFSAVFDLVFNIYWVDD